MVKKEQPRPYVIWAEEEEAALRRGVDKFGVGAWEVIRKDAELSVLATRTGVQLKDKWRNLVKFRHIPEEECRKLKPKTSGPWSKKIGANRRLRERACISRSRSVLRPSSQSDVADVEDAMLGDCDMKVSICLEDEVMSKDKGKLERAKPARERMSLRAAGARRQFQDFHVLSDSDDGCDDLLEKHPDTNPGIRKRRKSLEDKGHGAFSPSRYQAGLYCPPSASERCSCGKDDDNAPLMTRCELCAAKLHLQCAVHYATPMGAPCTACRTCGSWRSDEQAPDPAAFTSSTHSSETQRTTTTDDTTSYHPSPYEEAGYKRRSSSSGPPAPSPATAAAVASVPFALIPMQFPPELCRPRSARVPCSGGCCRSLTAALRSPSPLLPRTSAVSAELPPGTSFSRIPMKVTRVAVPGSFRPGTTPVRVKSEPPMMQPVGAMDIPAVSGPSRVMLSGPPMLPPLGTSPFQAPHPAPQGGQPGSVDGGSAGLGSGPLPYPLPQAACNMQVLRRHPVTTSMPRMQQQQQRRGSGAYGDDFSSAAAYGNSLLLHHMAATGQLQQQEGVHNAGMCGDNSALHHRSIGAAGPMMGRGPPVGHTLDRSLSAPAGRVVNASGVSPASALLLQQMGQVSQSMAPEAPAWMCYGTSQPHSHSHVQPHHTNLDDDLMECQPGISMPMCQSGMPMPTLLDPIIALPPSLQALPNAPCHDSFTEMQDYRSSNCMGPAADHPRGGYESFGSVDTSMGMRLWPGGVAALAHGVLGGASGRGLQGLESAADMALMAMRANTPSLVLEKLCEGNMWHTPASPPPYLQDLGEAPNMGYDLGWDS